MLHIFIDTNVLLRFYGYSDDTLAEVEKLAALVATDQIRLLTPRQVVEEWSRNRDKQIEDSQKRLDQIGSASQIPRFAMHLDEATILSDAIKKVKSARVALSAAIAAELGNEGLRADQVIEALFEAADIKERTPEIVARARPRRELGNPPGKNTSLGDQVNWETLLEVSEVGTDLHVISKDGDFQSAAFIDQPGFFIKKEWKRLKNGELFLYKGLAEFTKAHFPNIALPSEILKIAAVDKLIASGNYATTHSAISGLEPYIGDLSTEEEISLLFAAINNSQISDIINDIDVSEFYKKVYDSAYIFTSRDMDASLQAVSAEVFGTP